MNGFDAQMKAMAEKGHPVTPAEGVPGLFDVAGIGRDLTVGQLHQVVQQTLLPTPPL